MQDSARVNCLYTRTIELEMEDQGENFMGNYSLKNTETLKASTNLTDAKSAIPPQITCDYHYYYYSIFHQVFHAPEAHTVDPSSVQAAPGAAQIYKI